MIEPKNNRIGASAVLLGVGLCGACLLGAFCLISIIMSGHSSVLPILPSTPTLDPACGDADCLRTCLQRVPGFMVQPLIGHTEDLAKPPNGFELARYRLNEETDQLEKISTPGVPEYLKPYQADTDLDLQIWDYFSAVIPHDPQLHVSYMVSYTDGRSNGSAARIKYLDGIWRLYVDILDFDNAYDATVILIHEYGHMLTLNDTQILSTPDVYGLTVEESDLIKMRDVCPGFFDGYVCAAEDSYLGLFGRRFWTGRVYDSWIKVFLDQANQTSDPDLAVENFHDQYPDQFISRYAATNPDEDIAESWQSFVSDPKPAGSTIAEQKVLFFYQFPELVQQRRQIIQNVCKYAADHE